MSFYIANVKSRVTHCSHRIVLNMSGRQPDDGSGELGGDEHIEEVIDIDSEDGEDFGEIEEVTMDSEGKHTYIIK